MSIQRNVLLRRSARQSVEPALLSRMIEHPVEIGSRELRRWRRGVGLARLDVQRTQIRIVGWALDVPLLLTDRPAVPK